MTPEQIEAFLNQGGGRAGAPETDANGVTTHRSVDGHFIRIDRNGNVIGGGQADVQGTEDQQAPSSASAPSRPPGGGMTQQELEALLQQRGPFAAGDFTEEVKNEDVPNPAAYDENGQYIQGTPLTVKGPVTYRTWVKAGTNQRVTVKVKPDGTYEKAFDGPDRSITVKDPTGAPQRTPEERTKDEADAKNAAELQRQREANAALPKDQDPAYETDKERRDRAEARIKQQGEDARREAERNKPGAPTLKPDGKGGTIAVQTMPDGTIKTTPLPGVPSDKPNPERVTVDGVVYERNPDTGTYAPAAGLPQSSTNKPIPGDAPVYAPRQESPDLGLTEYARSVRQRTDLSKEAQDQLIREAHATAGTVVSRGTAIVNAQENTRASGVTQRGQDVQLANQRLSTAGSTFGNALTAANDATKYSVGPDSSAVLPYYLMLAQQNGANYGGLVNPAPVGNGPAITQMQGQSLPGVAGLLATSASGPFANGAAGAAAEEAARQAAAAQAAAPGPQPPVLDDHRIPAPAPSPAQPVPPAQQPVAPAVGVNPDAGQALGPTGDSGPLPQPGMNPDAGQGLGPTGDSGPLAPVAPAGVGPTPPVGGAVLPGPWNTPEVVAPVAAPVEVQSPVPVPAGMPAGGAFPPMPVVPRAGTEAGGNVQMVPVQGGSVASMLGAGPWQEQPAPAPTTGAVGTQMMAEQGVYDPTEVNDAWLAAGMDPEIVRMFSGGQQRVA